MRVSNNPLPASVETRIHLNAKQNSFEANLVRCSNGDLLSRGHVIDYFQLRSYFCDSKSLDELIHIMMDSKSTALKNRFLLLFKPSYRRRNVQSSSPGFPKDPVPNKV